MVLVRMMMVIDIIIDVVVFLFRFCVLGWMCKLKWYVISVISMLNIMFLLMLSYRLVIGIVLGNEVMKYVGLILSWNLVVRMLFVSVSRFVYVISSGMVIVSVIILGRIS